MANFKILKETKIKLAFKDISDYEEGKLKDANGWVNIKDWFFKSKEKYFTQKKINWQGSSYPVYTFPSNEALNDVKSIMKTDAVLTITKGNDLNSIDENKKWIDLDLSVDIWADDPRTWEVFFNKFWNATDNYKLFYDTSNWMWKREGLKFGKKYFPNVVGEFRLTTNNTYRYDFIKSLLDNGVLKMQEDVAYDESTIEGFIKDLKSWTDTFGTKNPVEVKTDLDNKNQQLNKWKQAFPADKYPNGLEDVKNQLEQAQKDQKNFIDPNDKTKLEAAAKNAGFGFKQEDIDNAVKAEQKKKEGFIDPKDLEAKAKEKGLVSQADYNQVLAERDSRPNLTLTDYQNLQNNQEKHKPEDLEHHKPEDLKPVNLPANWETELARISILEANQKPADLPADWKEQKKQLESDLVKKKKEAEEAGKYFQGLLEDKDKKNNELEDKLKQIATKLGTTSDDPALLQKVENLTAQKPAQPDSTPEKTSDSSSGAANSAALQQQKQTKENELQAELQKLRQKWGKRYPEDDLNQFLKFKDQLVRSGGELDSSEYQGWKDEFDNLVEERWLEKHLAEKISQLQEEITKLAMQLENQTISQIEAGGPR